MIGIWLQRGSLIDLTSSEQMFAPYLMGDPLWQALFAPHGKLLKAGDTIRRINYSRTLSIIAEEGPDAFYEVKSILSNVINPKQSFLGAYCERYRRGGKCSRRYLDRGRHEVLLRQG